MQKDPQARIVDTKQWGNYHLLSIKSPLIANTAQPGQFIMIRVSSLDFPLLRRPLSIHAKKKDTIDVFFQVSGSGTALLSQKETGDSLDILGPLGRGFSVKEESKKQKVALIGGGRGIAPLFFLAQELRRQGARFVVYYGGQTQSDLPLKDKFVENDIPVFCSTDDGSWGFHGFVTELFEKESLKTHFSCVYACGPEAMLKTAGQLCSQKNIPGEFSLESMMGCGFGACWGCVAKIQGETGSEWQKTCEKGPVFAAKDIIWLNEIK